MSLEMFDAPVPSGSLAMWWLSQAGFAFKTAAGKVVYVDPYLSDSAERLHGFKRLSPPAIASEDVRTDWVVITHEHTDHLDPDAIPIIARNNPACRFAVPAGCLPGLETAQVRASACVTLDGNRQYDLEGFTIHTAPADHGDFSVSALSLLLEFDGVRVLLSGDTSYRPQLHKSLYDLQPDVVLPCINGVFGNMNHIDAAMMVQQIRPRYAIPCHFWTFAEQGAGDPGGFIHACRNLCPDTKALLLRSGERFICEKK